MTYQIYKMLRDCNLSGDEIGKRLNVSRAAINKHIMKLRAEGVVINSSSGVGYQWVGENGVNEYAIRYELDNIGLSTELFYQTVGSTNTYAKSRAMDNNSDLLVVAPYQTAGRGRLNKTFSSKEGGAYFSLVINNLNIPLATVMRMVIISGIAVRDTLKQYGINAKLKWPNDVIVDNKKICGILLELMSSGETADKIIIGIGININNNIDDIKDIATRMLEHTSNDICIAKVITEVVKKIYDYIEMLLNGEWKELKIKYESLSYSIGRMVECNSIRGKALRITDEGFLIVEVNGVEERIITGDVNIC